MIKQGCNYVDGGIQAILGLFETTSWEPRVSSADYKEAFQEKREKEKIHKLKSATFQDFCKDSSED